MWTYCSSNSSCLRSMLKGNTSSSKQLEYAGPYWVTENCFAIVLLNGRWQAWAFLVLVFSTHQSPTRVKRLYWLKILCFLIHYHTLKRNPYKSYTTGSIFFSFDRPFIDNLLRQRLDDIQNHYRSTAFPSVAFIKNGFWIWINCSWR